jgi:hypothetical protein
MQRHVRADRTFGIDVERLIAPDVDRVIITVTGV